MDKNLNLNLVDLINVYKKNSKIFSDINWAHQYCDEPQLYLFGIVEKDLSKYSDGFIERYEPHSTGASFDLEKALIKVIGEIIERHCCNTYRYKDFLFGTKTDITNSLDPVQFLLYTSDLINKNSNFNIKKNDKFNWLKGKSLLNNKDVYIPSQLIYTNYDHQRKEKIIQYQTSNGAGAGFSIEDAVYRGIMELIERDAFMIFYLNKICPKKVETKFITNTKIQYALQKIKDYNLNLSILNITTDLNIPTYLAIIIDPTFIGMPISFGAKSDFSSESAILGAIEEVIQVRSWMRSIYENYKEKHKVINKDQIVSIIQRGIFWFDKKLIKSLDFFLNTSKIERFKPITLSNNKKFLFSTLKKRLLKNKIEIFYVDVTTKEFTKSDYRVVKVISPQLMPIYFNEKYPLNNCKRIYELPVKLGYLIKPNAEKQLNKIPHPFL